ncbi:ATP-binding protein [Oxalobacteraceae bacterium R-40]|uniref:ATP-binding protein n=1 Tax=Keguizhuia sedimenti TaxID=3064264 RepID=A0ABU1BPH6_9BURK|nr:ATP-binding protein [Oxalobacteraceae bacterium R-40]
MPSVSRVAILGAESTGKSTLAATLAAHYNTLWVPEYLREFVETYQRTPQEHEQFHIAVTQVRYEAKAIQRARSFLFCDTTPLMTALYSRFYFGRIDAPLEALASTHSYDFTIVTPPTSPWVPDGLQRESPEVRQTIHEQLLATLDARAIPYLLVDGDAEERVRRVTKHLPAQD